MDESFSEDEDGMVIIYDGACYHLWMEYHAWKIDSDERLCFGGMINTIDSPKNERKWKDWGTRPIPRFVPSTDPNPEPDRLTDPIGSSDMSMKF